MFETILEIIGAAIFAFSVSYLLLVLILLRSRKPDKTSPQASGEILRGAVRKSSLGLILEASEMTSPVEWRRAIHECGHACMAALLAVPIIELTERGLIHDGHASREEVMLIAGAGRAAQILLQDFHEEDWKEDSAHIDSLIEKRFPNPVHQRIAKGVLLLDCERGLRRHFHKVEALATALLAYGRLSGTQVRKIIKGLA